MFGLLQKRVKRGDLICRRERALQKFHIVAERRHGKPQSSRLTDLPRNPVGIGGEEVTGSAQLKVLFGNFVAVVRLTQNFQTLFCRFALVVGDENAPRFITASPDTTAQLMQLGQSEVFGVFDDHQRGSRHVDTDLNDGGRDKNGRLTRGEAVHDGILFRGLHFAVQKSDGNVGKNLLGKCFGISNGGFHRRTVILYRLAAESVRVLLRFVNGRADDVDLMSLLGLFSDKAVQTLAVGFVDGKGRYLLPSGRHFVEYRHFQIAEQHECHRARDRRCGHDQRVYILRFFGKCGTLTDTEAVLLVRDDKTAVCKHDVVLKKGMRADDKRKRAVGKPLFDRGLLFCFRTADKQGAVTAKGGKQRC